MKQEVASFLDYVAHSPTVFQATQQACDMLDAAGFTRLSEHEAWEILPGGRYYVTRNRSALVAFAVPTLIVVCYGQTFGWNSSFILIMIFCAVSALFASASGLRGQSPSSRKRSSCARLAGLS